VSDERRNYIQLLMDYLRERKLVWFGVRGCDSNPLRWYPNFTSCFSYISPSNSFNITDHCLERLTGKRVNLDIYDIDLDNSEAADRLRALLCHELDQYSVLMPYRPRRTLDAVYFPRSNHVDYLGLFQEKQAPFEHKIWVENALRKEVRVMPWHYLTAQKSALDAIEENLQRGPQVIRLNKSSGGTGFQILHDANGNDFGWSWIKDSGEGYFSFADYMHPSVSLSVSACAFPRGEVSIHPFSIQIIGDPLLTTYPLGFCGSDFGRVRGLRKCHIDELEDMVRRVGKWLTNSGYIGAFGVDALIWRGELYLTEVNPRFLGSSALSAEIDEELGLSDIFMAHMGAFLGLSPPDRPPLNKLYREQPDRAQIICHNTLPWAKFFDLSNGAALGENMRVRVTPDKVVILEPGATICRIVVDDVVSREDGKLNGRYRTKISRFLESICVEKKEYGVNDA
jgi:hypothetical protein